MTVGTEETERRLRETLRRVAEQTSAEAGPGLLAGPRNGAEADHGDPPESAGIVHLDPGVRSGRRAPDPGPGSSRTVWLAAAAALLVVAGGLGLWFADRATDTTDVAAEGGPPPSTPAQTTTEPAIEPGSSSGFGAGPVEPGPGLIPAADGSLYVVPTAPWSVFLDGETGPAQLRGPGDGAPESGQALIVGRPTPSGYENLVAVFEPVAGTYSVDEDSATIIDGRTLLDSFDEGVVERLDDRTVLYQAEFGDPGLDEIVAATTLVDGDLVFTGPTPSGLELLQVIDNADQEHRIVVGADLRQGSDVTTVTVFSDRLDGVDDPALALLTMADAPVATRIEVGGAPGYAFGLDDLDPGGADPAAPTFSMLAWEPEPGYVVLFQAGLDRADAVALAESFGSVDSRSDWETAWTGD